VRTACDPGSQPHRIQERATTTDAPLSRETTRVDDLKQSLPLCRLIFGQPRQEELLEFLKRHSSEGTTAASAPTFGKIADRARAF
jgi:hypothetical protein